MLKRTGNLLILLMLFSISILKGQMQSEYFDAFYGGGIGYTPGLFIIPAIDLPASAENPDFSGPKYMHGVQGWGTISKRWRIGASVVAGRNDQSFGAAGTDTITYTRFALSSSQLFAEYVIPLSAKSQIALNAGAGVSNLSIRYLKNPNDRQWDDLFLQPGSGTHLTVKGAVSLYPMVSWLWQFMHRGGLRINAGANMVFLPQAAWRIDDFYTVSNAAGGLDQMLVSPAFQAFIYFGL